MVDQNDEGEPEHDDLEEAVVRFALLVSADGEVDLDAYCARHPEAWREALRERCLEVQRLRSDLPRRDPEAAGAFPPERIGGYRIERELGRGGMGVVFLAHPEAGGDSVAIKVLLINALVTTRAVQRFRREMEATRQLDHPGIVPVLDVGEEAGYLFIVMAYVPGPSLAQVLAERADEGRESGGDDLLSSGGAGAAASPNARAAAIAAALADALHAAHERGLIHRDVKPANILFDDDGAPMLFDFGLAKDLSEESLSLEGELAGTPSYMSPEQALGKRVAIDRRTDVFSLGVVLYEMLAGRRPFGGDTLHELFYAISFKEPPELRRLRPELPRDLVTIAAKAMEKDPDHRFPTAAAMADDLRRFLNHESIVARPVGPARALARRARAHPALSFTAGLLLALLVALPFLLDWWAGQRIEAASFAHLSLTSDPPGARVRLRYLEESGAYSPPMQLGVTPLSETPFEPGIVRIIVEGENGAFAELTRFFVEPAVLYEEEVLPLRPTAEVVAPLVRIEPGEFRAGTTNAPSDFPQYERVVSGEGFHVMRDEVSCAQYHAFLVATDRPLPDLWPNPYDSAWDDVPAFGISFDDARACAEWMGMRLPTYWESQRMARGLDHRPYPDGSEPPEDFGAHGLLGAPFAYEIDPALDENFAARWRIQRDYMLANAQRIGSGPLEGPSELRHLLGNLIEWTETPNLVEPRSEATSDTTTTLAPHQMFTYGGHLRDVRHDFDDLQTEGRDSDKADLGFRCVKSLRP